MDLERLVEQAREGDVSAFVELTRRFQHFAFGSALALVHDFQKAEDVTQEAFVVAWSSLSRLTDPAAFPGWLRTIVRNHAFRVLRAKSLEAQPLADAENVASDQPAQDTELERRQQARLAIAALVELPLNLREPASLFFLHDCSQQDIAVFLSLPVATINNRLHAARSLLKKNVLTMVTETLQSSRLPDDFANRIGRLVAGRGCVVDALFDPAALPDLLTEISVSDEAHRDVVRAQVVQRLSGGVVRAVGAAPVDAVPRGATVLSSGRHTETTIGDLGIERLLPLLTQHNTPAAQQKILETGIKVIDVLCPMIVGGSVALAGEPNAGMMVLMGELVRRLGRGAEPLSLLVLWPPPSPQWPLSLEEGFSHAEILAKHGHTEGTVGPLQAFHLRGILEWTPDRLSTLEQLDTTIHLSRALGLSGIYPPVQPLTSRSRALEKGPVSGEHAAIAGRVRTALKLLADSQPDESKTDRELFERAQKLRNFFSQPFYMTEQYTKRPGSFVSRLDALRGCQEILDGEHDDLPPAAFYFTGGIEDVRTGHLRPT